MSGDDRASKLPYLGDAAWQSTQEAETKTANEPPMRVTRPPPQGGTRVAASETTEYVLGEELGRGGLGRVLRAVDTRLGRPVAVKLLLRRGTLDERRFARESLVTARLQHPAIIPVYDAGITRSGEPFYAMRLVSGEPLSKRLRRCKTLAERLALVPHVILVAEAIAYAHSRGFIHRDLKPDNVLVGEFGETVVIDWGLAKYVGDGKDAPALPEVEADQTLTAPGRVLGTPAYMAPEQARGESLDGRADVYAIGAILYRVLTGRAPYLDEPAMKLLQRVAREAPPAIDRLEPAAPRDLAAIARKAMARDPKARYASARELAQDLERFQTGQLVAARSYTRAQIALRWARRNAVPLGVALGAMASLAIVAGASVRRIVAERDRADGERAQAEAAQHVAVARADDLTLIQARGSLTTDPTAAAAWLKRLSPEWARWPAARAVALEAHLRGVAVVLRGHEGGVWSLAYASDGRTVASGAADHTIRLWDVAKRTSRVLEGHEGDVTGVAFSPDGHELASTSLDGTTRLWDVATGTSIVIARHAKMALAVAFSPDGGAVASSGGKGGVNVWRRRGANDWFHDFDGGVVGIAFSPDGRTLAYAGEDHRVFLRDLAAGTVRTMVDTASVIPSVAFSPDGARLVTTADDHDLRVWDLASGKATLLHGHTAKTYQAIFSRDGESVVSAGMDKVTRVFHLGYGTSQALVGQDIVTSVATSPDGRWIAAGSSDKTVRLYPTDGLELPVVAAKARAVAFAGRRAAVGAGHDVLLVDLDRHTSRRIGGHDDAVTSVAFDRAGKLLVSTGEDHVARLWDADGGAPLGARTFPATVSAAAFTPDGARLAAGCQDGVTRIFRVADFTGTATELREHEGPVYDVAFSPDGARLATAGWDKTVRLWDTATWTPRVLRGHGDWVVTVAFSPDGERVASGSYDGTLRVWSAATGDGSVLARHSSWVLSVAPSRDGAAWLTAGADRQVHAWDARTGAELWSRDLGKLVMAAAQAPEGDLVASGDEDGVRLWSPRMAEGSALRAWADDATNAAIGEDGTLVVP